MRDIVHHIHCYVSIRDLSIWPIPANFCPSCLFQCIWIWILHCSFRRYSSQKVRKTGHLNPFWNFLHNYRANFGHSSGIFQACFHPHCILLKPISPSWHSSSRKLYIFSARYSLDWSAFITWNSFNDYCWHFKVKWGITYDGPY